MNLLTKIEKFKKQTKGRLYGISGIYIILNIKSNKYYLGSSKNINNRWKEHKSLLRRNKHSNNYLQNAWNKYKETSFMFLMVEKTTDLVKRENYYLTTYIPYNEKIGYNIKRITEETQRKPKISLSDNTWKKTICSREQIERLAEMRKKAALCIVKGEDRYGAKLTNRKVMQIREMLELGFCTEIVAKTFKISDGTISRIKSGKRWSHLPYISPFPNLKKGKEILEGIKEFKDIKDTFFPKILKVVQTRSKLTKNQILNIKNMYLLGFASEVIVKTLKISQEEIRSVIRFNIRADLQPDLSLLEKQL